MISGQKPNISAYAFRVTAIRELLRERESILVKIPCVCVIQLAMNLQSWEEPRLELSFG
jgi:hypothetical protein